MENFFRLNTHRELYNTLKNVVCNGDIQETSLVDKHVATLFLSDFELCAIHLPESIREKVVQLNYYILQVYVIILYYILFMNLLYNYIFCI